jgi:hypothetical protein
MKILNKRFLDKKNINFITVFLIVDLLIIFALIKTANATYTSVARSSADMEVALYSFRYDGMYKSDDLAGTNTQSVDITLGEIEPGETKYFKFKVYNTDENNTLADTNISYTLKVIATTNINLDYTLYLNENSMTGNDEIDSSEITDVTTTDSFGTYFRTFTVDERCFKFDGVKFDEYTLKVTFPNTNEFKKVEYQDLVESIKVQLTSKQVLPGDAVLSRGVCR